MTTAFLSTYPLTHSECIALAEDSISRSAIFHILGVASVNRNPARAAELFTESDTEHALAEHFVSLATDIRTGAQV